MKKKPSIDLIWLTESGKTSGWEYGMVWPVKPNPSEVYHHVQRNIDHCSARYWLFWDEKLGPPNVKKIIEITKNRGNLWHAGLKLGIAGAPRVLDYVRPTWMHNRDPNPDIEASSWRMSLRAALIPVEILKTLGGPLPNFSTLEGASLEMGYRYFTHGIIMRYVPDLVSSIKINSNVNIPVEDELRFLNHHFPKKWVYWVIFRAIMDGHFHLLKMLKTWMKIKNEKETLKVKPFTYHVNNERCAYHGARISVLIPTVDRYPYLRRLLNQLRKQTVSPHEIFVIDQTPEELRPKDFYAEFTDLPLRVFYMDEAGQCRSRNLGIMKTQGDYILFLDDDDEIPDNLIELHLNNLYYFRADVSSGVADEMGALPLPDNFQLIRVSDVFPTNNTLIRKDILNKSGLFDLAYDNGKRADGDLGMRIYLSGALMILNPEIRVLHHHASRGGLRIHGARKITYASSRTRLFHRHLPSVTEFYLMLRYFTQKQIKENILLSLLGTFSIRGPRTKKIFKFLISLILFPHSCYIVWRRKRLAKSLFKKGFPNILMPSF